LGQVKEAWQIARNAGVMKTALDRLFQHTFSVAKRVRTDTRIGTHPVSVAFASVRLAQQVFTDLREATVLLIGAGDTIELAARHLSDAKAKRLLVANRTLAHAQDLASRHGGYAFALPDLDRHLAEADIVISATASREPVLLRSSVEIALRARRQRPMFMLDLAVPRDIEASIRDLDDVYLYTVDDLDQVIAENRQSRREAADQAEAIIDLQVAHFMGWWQGAGRQTTITRVRNHSEQIRDETLQRARALLASGKDPVTALEFLAHNLTNKLLHAPSANLRQAALSGDTDLLRAAERLFDLPSPETPDDSEPTSQA
ncbi:MAG: glutamyl-tRNA reductase, partial [Gammaproteobacteria bacterium HGW-Gammaproteobacteria-1]